YMCRSCGSIARGGDRGQCGARQNSEPRVGVRHERNVTQSQGLAKSFIIREQERLVLPDRAAQRTAENVALKVGNLRLIEKIPGVQRAIPQELVSIAMNLIGAGGGHDIDLCSGALAVLGAVRVRNN